MLNKMTIISLLESLHEHIMAKNVFVHVLEAMGLEGIRFTGGTDEHGIDIEYYERTKPENHKSYVGIQFKKGSLTYSSKGAKGSVKDVRNQAEEAFEKEIHDLEDKSTRYISRFIVAVTGTVNENARIYIGRARQKGQDRRIDYWEGDRLAEYIQSYWMDKFESYFSEQLKDVIEEEDIEEETLIIDEDYLEGNYSSEIKNCKMIYDTLNGVEWRIIKAIAISGNSYAPMADVLMYVRSTEENINRELTHLVNLDSICIDEDDYSVNLTYRTKIFYSLYNCIIQELIDAEEDTDIAEQLFNNLFR